MLTVFYQCNGVSANALSRLGFEVEKWLWETSNSQRNTLDCLLARATVLDQGAPSTASNLAYSECVDKQRPNLQFARG